MPQIEATVLEGGWPKDLKALDGVAAIVIACDGNNLLGPESNWKALDDLARKGVGIAFLHYALDPGDERAPTCSTGSAATTSNTGRSTRPGSPSSRPCPSTRSPAASSRSASTTNGTITCSSAEQMEGVTPILTAVPPDSTRKGEDGPHSGNPTVRARKGMAEHVAWAVERPDGGRGFGCTGGHTHWVYAQNDFRKLMLNAVCWIARIEVPADGVPTPTPTVQEMEANLEGDRPATGPPRGPARSSNE